MYPRQIVVSVIACAIVLSCAAAAPAVIVGAELYRSQLDSGVGWGTNASGADVDATFGYDYSINNIPEAPNSRGGDTATRGLKLEANIVEPAFAESLYAYPIGENFTGNYVLRFDAWQNYNADERINGGSLGTTEFLGGAIGYDGVSSDIGTGAEAIHTGDGGSGSDWRAFADGAFFAIDAMAGGSRNASDPYYSDFLPGVPPPAGQPGQTAFPAGVPGAPGFQWLTHEIAHLNGVITWTIEKPGGERLRIIRWKASDFPTTTDGNIGLFYADFFSSVSPHSRVMFGLIDNVEVSIAAPTPAALTAGAVCAALLAARRRRRGRA